MNLTVQDLVTRVRDVLADTGDRWSDDRLIRLIDEAQKNICRRLNPLRNTVTIVVSPSQNTYTLPSNTKSVSGVLYNDNKLTQISNNEEGLENLKGLPIYFTTNKLERGLLKIIPTPVFVENDPFDLTKANTLTLYYIKNPETLTSLTDELELEDLYMTTLKHYIVGNLLREDTDAQNRAFGNEELSLYESELRQLTVETEKDFNSNPTYETKYWRV